MDSIKLQVLLKRPLRPDELQRVDRALTEIGATITGRGTVTLSATMPKDQFEKTFSTRFEGRSGFSLGPESAAILPVPPELHDYVDSISETPRHIRLTD